MHGLGVFGAEQTREFHPSGGAFSGAASSGAEERERCRGATLSERAWVGTGTWDHGEGVCSTIVPTQAVVVKSSSNINETLMGHLERDTVG